MSLADLVQTWGYPALFLGTLFEGETALVLGGVAAQSGYLDLPWVITIAVIGGSCGDQFFFWVGKRFGKRILERYPRLAPRAMRVHALLERYHQPVILALRFLYGLRTIGPITIGSSRIPWLRFAALDLAGAVIWASLGAVAGFLLGRSVQLLLGKLEHAEIGLAVAVVVLGIGLWWVQRRRKG